MHGQDRGERGILQMQMPDAVKPLYRHRAEGAEDAFQG